MMQFLPRDGVAMASLGFSVSDFLSPAQPDASCALDRFQQLQVDSLVVSGHSSSYVSQVCI